MFEFVLMAMSRVLQVLAVVVEVVHTAGVPAVALLLRVVWRQDVRVEEVVVGGRCSSSAHWLDLVRVVVVHGDDGWCRSSCRRCVTLGLSCHFGIDPIRWMGVSSSAWKV